MIIFLFFYFFVYIFFLFFSILFIFFFFIFFIFLSAYNLDSIVIFQFDLKAFKSNWKETIDLYIKLALVFFHNYKEFLLGDDIYNYNLSFRKFVILCIFFTGYFHYFLLFIIIFFFSVILLLFIFSFLRPLFEELHKTIKIYSKRAEQFKWNEQIYIFFNSFIKDEGLLNFVVRYFQHKL